VSQEELKAMEATDKTKVIEDEPGKKKSKLHLLKDKVRLEETPHWWFQTCFVFHNIWDIFFPLTFIFFKMVLAPPTSP